MSKKSILFAGYAPVHFVCFEPVYRLLRENPRLEIWLSGGFKQVQNGDVKFSLDGFYDSFEIDHTRVISHEQAKQQDFDVLICGHLSDSLFPRSVGRSVQIFHGVSVKNRCIREKALRYDYLCLPGRYHAEMYLKHRLVRPDGSRCFITGFPKVDEIIHKQFNRDTFLRKLGINPDRPTILYTPTGDKNNSLEIMGQEVVNSIQETRQWNFLIKLHDHPKNTNLEWIEKLSKLEDERIRLIHDWNVVPYLQAADLLITDASSVGVEYTLLDRPIVLLEVPKLLKKLARKHTALDMETYGQKIGFLVGKNDNVVDAIKEAFNAPRLHSKIRRRMANHIFHNPGSSSSRVASIILYAAGLNSSIPDDVEELKPGSSIDEQCLMQGGE